MTLLAVAVAVGLLIALVVGGKVHPLLSFLMAAMCAALMLGMPPETVPRALEKGIGDMLGSLAPLVVLGAMFGKLIADSGAAQRIAESLMGAFSLPLMGLAMAATGLIVGIPLFYNVGFVVMVPLIFSVAQRTGLPSVYVGIPLLAGLSIAHGFLPPHPSPMALLVAFDADMGLTMIYGLMVSVPTLLIAGPVFALSLRSMPSPPPPLFAGREIDPEALPSTAISFFTALLPVALIGATTALAYLPGLDPGHAPWVAFISHPVVVLLAGLMVGVFTLGVMQGRKVRDLMDTLSDSLRDIAPIILIIAGAGALKEVFVQSGVSTDIAALLTTLPVPVLPLAWLVAGVLRICLGSATVAGLTTAGLFAPLAHSAGVEPNLLVLAVGAGSLICSHVNDSGFWMFKEYFRLSLKDTFRSWSVMETLVGVLGLGFVMILDLFV